MAASLGELRVGLHGTDIKVAAVIHCQHAIGPRDSGLQGDLDIPRSSGNHLSVDQISPLPQDEVRVAAWAEVWRHWNYNSRRLVGVL